ncbi:complement component C8 alpha chain [Seriola dumerili]|uniref:complement component C8 alpha chain n=1 Tax=Seriola dumerili TaxID=41447 RepID=UPI000BBEAA6B|nr:complement component C8 alpha chain [Seriola dumerili]
MGIFVNLLLGLCALHLFINFTVDASRRPWTTADNRGARARMARAANNPIPRPTPVNCRLTNWKSWTPCDSCTDIQFRFRYLEKPSQFGGEMCGDLWERLKCPAATTNCSVPDYCGASFTCPESGRCISNSLLCNGESDCGSGSDEEHCQKVNQRKDKCSTLMPIPGAERGTLGYNILTGDFMNHVLDSNYFGGQCEYVYNGEWRKFTYDSFCENLNYNENYKNYRKPYNYHTYHFVAQATSQGSHEFYEDVASLLKARQTLKSSSGGVTIGISKVEGGISGSGSSLFLNNITQFNSQDRGFIRLWSKVQTARFKMRTNKLVLHEEFQASLMELPEQYDFGVYYRFFNAFGTHYVTEGTMGGTLEYVAVLNKTAMANSELTASETESCLGASIGLSNPLGAQTALDLKLKGNSCGKDGSFEDGKKSDSSVIEDVLTLVKGGVTSSSSGLLAIKNPETYRNWGATLKYNPAVIEYEIMPIYELVRLSTVADHVGERLANLRKGWDEYVQQFHSCRCAPCRHNGIPVLSGTSCSCVCKSGYFGDSCEQTHRRDTKTDGSWTCWGSWSPCSSGEQTRGRNCTNPAPDGGGAQCLGSSSQSQLC